MKKLQLFNTWLVILLLAVLWAGCNNHGTRSQKRSSSGSDSEALGAPMVSSTDPVNNYTGGAINRKVVATFSEEMDPLTVTLATFTVEVAGVPVAGAVTYDGVTGIFTSRDVLVADTIYDAKILGGAFGVKDLAGNPMAADYNWRFTPGLAEDRTTPSVISTDPPDLAPNVVLNQKISATFSEEMDPLTITPLTFTVLDGITPVAGTVAYANVTATFTPSINLLPSTVYSCQIASGAASANDLALVGNPLAANYNWSFTTGALQDINAPTVTTTDPLDLAINVAFNKQIHALFSESMDPLSITTATFTLKLGATPVIGAVTYSGITAIFTPLVDLTTATVYDCKIIGGILGAKDLSSNPLAVDYDWSFTTDNRAYIRPPLGTARIFGGCGGPAGMTNQGILTQINGGNISTTAAATVITGFHDSLGNVYTETGANIGAVNGVIYTATTPASPLPVGSIGIQCVLDMQIAYNYLLGLPFDVMTATNQLGGGPPLPPAVYASPSGDFLITGGNLTLDAGGDANAVWVFQMASSLTVGTPTIPRSVILINGAQAKNVFWQVGSAARIEPGCYMIGTIIAYSGVTISTAGTPPITRLDGRALGMAASVTVVDTIINVPGP